jgi:O-antigen/teichoic acid export membrane protein
MKNIKRVYKHYLSGGSLLLIATVVVNICNFVFNAYLGRVLTFEQFGIITLINTMWYIALIPINALYTTVNHRIAFLNSNENTQESLHFLQSTKRRNLFISLFISTCFLAAVPLTDEFFQIHNYVITFLFTPMITFGVITAINKGFLQGIFNFKSVAIIIIIEAISKLIIAFLLVDVKMNSWVFISLPLSACAAFLLSFHFISSKKGMQVKSSMYQFPSKFFSAAVVTGISSIAFLSVDVILAKHFLTPTDAGKYAFLSLIGKMVYFFGALPNLLTVSFVSRDLGNKKNPDSTFYKLFSLALFLTVAVFIGVGPLGKIFIPLLFGNKTTAILPYLTLYSTAIMFFTLSSSFITFYLAKQRYFFSVLAILMAVIMCVGISLFHNGIDQIIHVIFYTSILSLTMFIFSHILEVNHLLKLNKFLYLKQ